MLIFRVVDGYAIFAWWLKYVPNKMKNYHVLQRLPENERYTNGYHLTIVNFVMSYFIVL